jgi:hypothetical protein
MVTAQDIPDGDRVDGMPRVGQGPLNPSITPRGIFLSHPDHELFDLLGDPRAPERVGKRRETAAFGLGQTQPSATELSFKDAVVLAQILDDLLLVILDPPGDHGD